MSEGIQFVISHWFLVLGLVVVSVLIFWNELKNRAGGQRLSAQELIRVINQEQGIVVDIRDPVAFEKGHIVHALNLPFAELNAQINRLNQYQNRPVILVDQTGERSAKALQVLSKKGFKRLSLLSGGINAWRQANLPLSQAGNKKNKQRSIAH